MKDIENDINDFIDDIQDHILESLKAAGMSFVDKARARTKIEGGFGNITFNLRASTACVIVKDHEIVFRYSPPISNAPEGNSKGIVYAEEITNNIPGRERFENASLNLCKEFISFCSTARILSKFLCRTKLEKPRTSRSLH